MIWPVEKRREWERSTRARKREVRAKSIPARTTKRELFLLRAQSESLGETEPRPATRAGCIYAQRPCPFVSCKHHLYLDVKKSNGSIKVNFPDLEPDELRESCTLDVAAKGGVPLEVVAEVMNLTRERVRQLEEIALRKMRAAALSMRRGEE